MFYSRRFSAFWGVLLILIGGLFMLSPLGLLKINVWNLIFPGFLVFWGLWIFFGMFTHPRTHTNKNEAVNIPLDGSKSARVRLRHSSGRLHVKDRAPSDQLIAGKFDGDAEYQMHSNGETLTVDLRGRRNFWSRDFTTRNWCGRGPRHMRSYWPSTRNWNHHYSKSTWPRVFSPWNWSWNGSSDWDLSLNEYLPLELSVDTQFSETRIDLRELQVTDLKLRTNMSTTEVTLPAHVGHTRASVRDTMSEIKVHIPEGVAARIHLTSRWEDVSVNEDRFPRNGDVYQSPDYDTSENRVEIDAKSDMGVLRIV